MSITVDQALEMQSILQEETYGKPLEKLLPSEVGPQTMMHVTALTDELHEVLRETPWKPWKKSAEFNQEAYKEEMVDAFHFFMNLMLIGNMDFPELLAGYEAKHAENIARQARGY